MYPYLLCNVDVMISTLQKRLEDALLSLVGPLSSFRIGSHLGHDKALLEAERNVVAAMNEVIFIFRLEIKELAARIMQANQELEEVRMLHLKTEEVLLFLLSEAQGNPGSSLDTS